MGRGDPLLHARTITTAVLATRPAWPTLPPRSRGLGLVLVRVVAGPTMVGHGTQYLFGWFGGGGLTGRRRCSGIRTAFESWALWRDADDWKRFATVWHTNRYMTATWFQGSAADFITAFEQAWKAGVRILHFLGGSSIVQTKMTITQRSTVHGEAADVVCTGHVYDFFEREDRHWRIVRRQPIYEIDRLAPVEPNSAQVRPRGEPGAAQLSNESGAP